MANNQQSHRSSPSGAPPEKYVLVADESRTFVKPLEEILSRNGYEMRDAYKRWDVFRSFKRRDYGVIIIDLPAAPLEILTLLKVYRESDKLTYILLVGEEVDQEIIRKLTEGGANKVVGRQMLMDTILPLLQEINIAEILKAKQEKREKDTHDREYKNAWYRKLAASMKSRYFRHTLKRKIMYALIFITLTFFVGYSLSKAFGGGPLFTKKKAPVKIKKRIIRGN